MPGPELSLDVVHRARDRLRGLARHTPLAASRVLSRLTGGDVRLKLESTQDTRSFKVRGAANAIVSRLESDRVERLVAYSTGNHGRATTHVATRLGLPVTVCMSSNTTHDKRSDLAAMGAEVRLVGDTQDEAARAAIGLADRDTALIDPIDDPATTAGHATRRLFGDNIALVATGGIVGAEQLCRVAGRYRQSVDDLLGRVAV